MNISVDTLLIFHVRISVLGRSLIVVLGVLPFIRTIRFVYQLIFEVRLKT